jgi:hypothetical protein
MKLQNINLSQFKDANLVRPPRGHIIGRIEGASVFRINSVFLSNRNLGSKINWQAELLKLEDAS